MSALIRLGDGSADRGSIQISETGRIGETEWSGVRVDLLQSPGLVGPVSGKCCPVRQSIGFLLQLIVLMFLPLVIGWQLFFGFPLLVMPTATLLGIVVFSLGHALRQSR